MKNGAENTEEKVVREEEEENVEGEEKENVLATEKQQKETNELRAAAKENGEDPKFCFS